MKKLIPSIIICLVGGWLIFSKPENVCSTPINLNNPSEVSFTISEFWQAAVHKDKTRLETITSKTPDDFYKMYNKCKDPADVIFSVDDSEIKYNRDDLLIVFSQIIKSNLASYNILEEKVSENHAAVRVEYGEPDNLIHNDLFLLNKENGQWKIFMISGADYLSNNNRYFAQQTCSEKSITEPFWK